MEKLEVTMLDQLKGPDFQQSKLGLPDQDPPQTPVGHQLIISVQLNSAFNPLEPLEWRLAGQHQYLTNLMTS